MKNICTHIYCNSMGWMNKMIITHFRASVHANRELNSCQHLAFLFMLLSFEPSVCTRKMWIDNTKYHGFRKQKCVWMGKQPWFYRSQLFPAPLKKKGWKNRGHQKLSMYVITLSRSWAKLVWVYLFIWPPVHLNISHSFHLYIRRKR
jgi:hypothetical protein